jgi:hypothetical protein
MGGGRKGEKTRSGVGSAGGPNAEGRVSYHLGKGRATGFPEMYDDAESHDAISAERKPCCRQIVVDEYLM